MAEEQKSYKDVYPEIDPLIKADPLLNWGRFKKEHPDLSNKITRWSYLRRRSIILGYGGYGSKMKNKKKSKKGARRMKKKETPKKVKVVKTIQNLKGVTDEQIVKYVSDTLPTSKNKREYVKLGKILVKNPGISYPDLKKKKFVTMSNPTYYIFRKNFINHFSANGKVEPEVVETKPKKKNGYKRKGTIYRSILIDKEASDVEVAQAKKIIGAMREEEKMNYEVEELKTGYEIRKFTK